MHNQGHSRRNKHYHFGADAPITVAPPTVSGSAAGLVHLALSPVKWSLNTAGNLVCWLGNTVHSISNKL